MPQKKIAAPARIKIEPPPCGYRIEKGATAGYTLLAGECAFTTYAPTISGEVGIARPTVAFWGPGQTIPATIGGGSLTVGLIGGVVFKNC